VGDRGEVLVMKQGLFVGLTTLDLIYLAESSPRADEKVVAIEQTLAAGGPATNAAVAFAHLGDRAVLYSVIGQHPLSQLLRSDLEVCQVENRDLNPSWADIPAISAITVTRSTGQRSVISLNATRSSADLKNLPTYPLQNVDIVLLDGHQIIVGEAIARQAKQQGIPVVIDGGSWKTGFEKILPWVDHAIVSTHFQPPACGDRTEVFAYLQSFDIPHIALTEGDKAIDYRDRGERGIIPVMPVRAVDTLGAGDIFHGAFCHFILRMNFPNALQEAAKVAAFSCQFFGTRQWLQRKESFPI
jgi:sugar/nucleoside kinase (ribokinase family)